MRSRSSDDPSGATFRGAGNWNEYNLNAFNKDPLAIYGEETGLSGSSCELCESDLILWGPNVPCHVLFDHEQLLHLRLESNKWSKPLFVTTVYAKCDMVERLGLWDAFRAISASASPSIVGGDFHTVLNLDEDWGRHPEAYYRTDDIVLPVLAHGPCTGDFSRLCIGIDTAERHLKDADEAYDLDPCDLMLVERNWCSAELDVFGAVTEFFHGVEMPKSYTATTISFIPKIASPVSWNEYRPISLCSVANKICTKLMTLKLGQLIHLLESCRPEANVIFKLDIAKAYDRVSWDFLYQVLRQKGFPHCWINLVTNIVSNYWFSVLVNGEHARLFAKHPSMYYQTLDRVRVSHLAYYDDMIIFTTICKQNMDLLRDFLWAYEQEGNKLLYVDGSSILASNGAGVVITSLEGDKLEYMLRFDFKASNNEAEYEALIAGIRMTLVARATKLIAYSASQLVNNQIEGKYEDWRIQDRCVEQDIQQRFTSVAYPQANWQIEITNQILVQGIKTKLAQSGGQWVDALPGVL
ncbi:hypothetical protein Sango_1179700 [Sesamum angolense]|uniref:Reverse transcriptase domain-containing protein n=1 Tax=Sesamum angolense TaxID=2727404 RepID=A0AAE1WWL5_9LAMI|nr:hypothetical protein Sango_1179700 [Sesamum angolense]